MKRVHSTKEKVINLKKKYHETEHPNGKPNGLWYGIDGAWKDWCTAEEFDGIYENNFLLEINLKDILIIETPTQLEDFHNKYSKDKLHIKGLNHPEMFFSIDWNAVRNRYKGIEIINFNEIKYNHFWLSVHYPMWFYGWDCDSGCIWDLSCINKIKKL